jgi:predicted ABC-type ATPase
MPEYLPPGVYVHSLSNFLKIYQPLADSWTVFDNSSDTPTLVAFQESGTLAIHDARKYAIVTGRKGSI